MLLDISMKYKNSLEKSKISQLAIKCLIKIHQILNKIINSIKLDRILLKLHLIICDFDRNNIAGLETQGQMDQMIIKFIKNFVYEFIKIKKEDIIGDYRLVEKHSFKDKYIIKWIKNILNSINNNNDNINLNNFPMEFKGITVKKMDNDIGINYKSDLQNKKIIESPLKNKYNHNERNIIDIDRDRDLSVLNFSYNYFLF
jgi:hypothetical protein